MNTTKEYYQESLATLHDEALDLDFRSTEVDEEANRKSSGFEVVEALSHVHLVKRPGRFQLNKNAILH